MPGPVGKRSDQKHGHRTQSELGAVDKVPSGASSVSELEWYPEDPEWHEIAKRWYASLRVSGQVVFYEQSDVSTAYYVAEAMSRSLQGARFSGQLFASIMSSMGDLVLTEGARRRAKIELQRASGDDSEESETDRSIQDLLNQFS